MGKRLREETDSGGATTTEDMTSYKAVFIDTNLDTHLAVLVSDSDTISHLKKKIIFEHVKCFPEMRELKISSVKVKWKEHYYHLPDTMLVRDVFDGTKHGWFLSVDASRFQCLGNDQGLLCTTYPQTEAENILPSDKQKVFDTAESYPAHGNLASSSIVKQKEVAKVIGEFKCVKHTDNSQELSPRSGPMAKKRKMKHKEDVVNLPVTNTSTSMHGKDNDCEFKIVGNDTTSTNSNEGERENINMKLVDVSADPLRNQRSDPSKVSKLEMKKSRMGEASAEIAGVQYVLRGNRNNETLGETSQSGTVANKVRILDSKESSRGSTELTHRDILKIAIPENSTAGKPIQAALAETLGDQSVKTDTAHKKRKKRRKEGKNSSTCHDEVACMVLGSTDKFEGTRGLELKEGVEMKIFDKSADVGSTINVTQSRLKETSLVKDHASIIECPAPVSKDIYEMNLVGRPILESIVSRDNELGTDVANTTGEQELRPPANHFVQGSNQDKNALPAIKKKGASEQVSKSAYAAGSYHQVEKATCIEAEPLPIEKKGNEVEHLLLNQTDKNWETLSIAEKRLKTKTKKSQSSKKSKSILSIQDQEVGHKDLAASNDNLEDNYFVQGSNQDKNALPASKKKGASEHVSKSAYPSISHHQVEKATCIEAEPLPVEEKENEVKHLLLNQTDKDQEILSIAKKRPKTKTKKSQSSKKNKSILSIQDQEVGHKGIAASNDNLEDVNPLPEPMEMDESGKNSHVDHLADTKLENQRNSGIHSIFESSRENVKTADSFTSTKEVLEEMHLPDVNTDKSEGINFKQYFVPGQQGEVASKKPTKSKRHTKAGRKSNDGRTSRGTLEDVSNSKIAVALPSRPSAQGDKTLEEAGNLATFDAPAYKKKSEESMDESTSSSSSKGPDKFPEDKRRQTGSEIQSLATINTKIGTGNIEDFTQPKKGLLPKPGPKFEDSRSRSYSKEGGNSDSTTETSSSSGNSVEGSEIGQASTPKGANAAKSNDGAKHKLKSNFLGEDITMDMILRSSSHFKKAKVTAAQC